MCADMVREEVNIYKLPAVDDNHSAKAGVEITIGDLHANAMKLMFFLVKHGVAKNFSEADYDALVKIYLKPLVSFDANYPALVKDDLVLFDSILDKIEFNKAAMVRLIGDELADRGCNDYFVLKILAKLREHDVPVEILLSNHGAEFVEAYETKDTFDPHLLDAFQHAGSMFRLQALIAKGIVTRDEVIAMVNKAYKPMLKAISYTLNSDNTGITIFSHASIGINTIKSIAEKLAVTYEDATAIELAGTIDKINAKFQEHVQANSVHTLYTREAMQRGYNGRVDLTDSPFALLVWNRLYEPEIIDRPAKKGSYTLNFVHGHDSTPSHAEHIFNLDNFLGKSSNHNEGLYTVLYSLTPARVHLLGQAKIDFNTQLLLIKDKAKQLQDKGYKIAAEEASKLHGKLASLFGQYCGGTLTGPEFKTQCNDALELARPELEQHQGWTTILIELASFILSIVTLGIANYWTGRNMFRLFAIPPTAAKNLEGLVKAANALESEISPAVTSAA